MLSVMLICTYCSISGYSPNDSTNFTNMKKGTFRYIHHGKTTFQTGLQFYLLQEYYLIALDVFRNFHYTNSSNSINLTEQELHAWISFLVTENLNDTNQLIQK